MNSKQIKVKLNGYFQKNLGDDLFFEILFSKFPDVEFYVDISPCYVTKSIAKNKNVKIGVFTKILYRPVKLILKCLKYSRLYIYFCALVNKFNRFFNSNGADYKAKLSVTGSCFFQQRCESEPLDLKKTSVCNKSYFLNKAVVPEFIVGCNVGPVYDVEFLEELKHRFEGYYNVSMRDKASYNLFSFMENVSYAPDIVFNYDTSKYSGLPKERSIVISLINIEHKINELSKKDNSLYYEKLAEIINQYSSLGYKVYIVSFCKYEKDDIAAKKTMKLLNKKAVKHIVYDGDPEEILKLFSQCEYVIAGRFHAMILAMLFKKPFFPICYDDKMKNYLFDLNYSGNWLDIKDFEGCDFEFVNSNLAENRIVPVEKHIESADLHFEKFRKYIYDLG
ncbi:MAG: polysaccharide pyruvyl transferase family protein [Eubacterium sp.]